MERSYGNVATTKLEEVIRDNSFNANWNISKEQISVCKACEYRDICTDCRAFLENPADPYSKPLKCGYDPNTGTWEAWSTHPLKKQAKEYYGFTEEPSRKN